MRFGLTSFVLVVSPLLSGCGPEAPVVVGIVAGAAVVVSAASLPVFHRTPVDMLVSAATGRGCSVVNLDRGERYCRPMELAPERPCFARDHWGYRIVGRTRRSCRTTRGRSPMGRGG